MANILLPLQIVDGKLKTTDKIVKSIDDFLSLLITTSQNDSVSARKFGFVFNNLRFEIFWKKMPVKNWDLISMRKKYLVLQKI